MATAYEKVQLARGKGRPSGLSFIQNIFPDFIELHGDRRFADDPAVIGGIATLGGRAVTVIAIEKGADTKDKVYRNFGSPNPEGYRKALRLMKQAEKFHRPVICFVDTSGAFCGIGQLSGYNGFADRAERQSRQFDVLPRKGNADDGHRTHDGRKQMPHGKPYSCQHKPDNITHRAQGARAHILFACKHIARHRHFAKGKKGKVAHDKTGTAPRNAHNGYKAEQPVNPPHKPHDNATAQKPYGIAKATDGTTHESLL